MSSGKSNLLSSLALKVGEQVHLCKQGGGKLPQQFTVKPGEAVKKGDRERVRQEGEKRNRWIDVDNLHLPSFKMSSV